MSNPKFLVGTMKGLYLLQGDKEEVILNRTVYGLTHRNGWWYAAERADNVGEGKIYRFQFDSSGDVNAEVWIDGLEPELHQIDWVDDFLYIAQSDADAVLVYDGEGELVEKFYPHEPPSPRRIDDPDYCRFNSVYRKQNRLYLLAHNRTKKTGRPSSIWVFEQSPSRGLKFERRIEGLGGNCHNILSFKDIFYYCDSMGKTVNTFRDGDGSTVEIKFECDLFTRGLSATDSCVAVGGSKLGERWERDHLGGTVFVLDWGFRELYRVDLPECGQIYEIRAVDQPDYGLSNTTLSKG